MIVYLNRDNVGKNLVPRSAIILPGCGIRFLGCGQHGLTLSRRFEIDCWWTAGKKLSTTRSTVEVLGVVI